MCCGAAGSYERAKTSVPAPSSAAASSSVCVAASVRGSGGSSPRAALSWLTSDASVPRIPAAAITAGKSACIATMSVVGSCTSHCVSWAFAVVWSSPSEPGVALARRNCAASLING